MPQRTFKTNRPCYINLSGGAILEGRQWDVYASLPTPLDETTQADTYRTANTAKVKSVDVFYIRLATSTRFGAPVPYVYPAGSHDCTQIPPVPHQTFVEERGTDGRTRMGDPLAGAYNWPRMGTVESEDCLFAMFCRPSGETNRPGLMHIHGGAWNVNSILGPQHSPEVLAAHKGLGVLIPAYRLSSFGHFPYSTVEVAGDPSVAYLDILNALEWFHSNAAALGVDATKIGISGTSAGGAAVQLLLTDDDAQPYFSAAWIGSGGGTGNYPDAGFYASFTARRAGALRALAPALTSDHPDYRTVQDAIDAQGLTWALQNAARAEHVQAFSDIGPTVTAASVAQALAGTGDLVASTRDASINIYPFRRGSYANAIEAAKDGKFRKPFVSLYAECEALNLLGANYTALRTALLALPTATLDEWAQRLGCANYAAWLAMDWQPVGGLEALSSAQFKTSVDPLAVDCENRRVLYTHAVFGYAAWRVARAAIEEASATSWLVVNNFSANSIWAGHSQEVSLMFGQVEWVVAGLQNFPDATPPGQYVNNRMDGLYASEIMMQMLAALCATGSPTGAYSYEGFDLFDSNPPADGGSLSLAGVTAYTLAQPGHANVFGKYADPLDNLNAGTFVEGSIELGLDRQRDAKITYNAYMNAAMLEYLEQLEP